LNRFALGSLRWSGYSSWENFFNVIEKAKTACVNSNSLIINHFRDVMKMVNLGSGTQREIPDIMLSRYACYLIAQNGVEEENAMALLAAFWAAQIRQALCEDVMAIVRRLCRRGNR
jgi:DNA-damage-inducible protein D